MSIEQSVDKIYRQRFAESDLPEKNRIWRILCADFFQKFVPADAIVLDIAAGYCEFINNIEAKRKIAVDLNPDTKSFAGKDVEVHLASSTSISPVEDSSVDVVFMSNFLEHLPSREEILATFRECRRVLKPGGALMVLQPNIRFLPGEYWDFFDHRIPITDRSLAEAVGIAGFKVETLIPRFLPYTTKSSLPKSDFLIRLYLRMPWVWRFFGKQAFLLARK